MHVTVRANVCPPRGHDGHLSRLARDHCSEFAHNDEGRWVEDVWCVDRHGAELTGTSSALRSMGTLSWASERRSKVQHCALAH